MHPRVRDRGALRFDDLGRSSLYVQILALTLVVLQPSPYSCASRTPSQGLLAILHATVILSVSFLARELECELFGNIIIDVVSLCF